MRRKQKRYLLNGEIVLFRNNILSFLLSLSGVLLKTLSILTFSVFTQRVLDSISGESVYTIKEIVSYALLSVFFILVGAFLEYRFWTKFRTMALNQYRENTVERILSKDADAFLSENISDFISALSNDLHEIKNNYIESLPYIFELAANFIGTIYMMCSYSLKLAGFAFLASLIPVMLSSVRMNEVAQCEAGLSDANSVYTGFFTETLQGFRTIKNMNAEYQVKKHMSEIGLNLSKAFSHREHVEISVAYIASISGKLTQILLFFLALYFSRNEQSISVGIIVAIVTLMPNLSQVAITMPELIAGVKATRNLIRKNDAGLEKNPGAGEEKTVTCEQDIRADSIMLQYNDSKPILDGVSVNLKAGHCYAIIGESGSGKTSLLNILSGRSKSYFGEVLYDGNDIKSISLKSLTDTISVIQQDIFIFDSTLKDNITMFGTYQTGIQEAIEKAGLKKVFSMKGEDYPCGINGAKLSGGEKQRIGIARALLKGTSVFFFDEITSSLDPDISVEILQTILDMEGTTRIIVTHDIYPEIMVQFDKVFSLQNGNLTEVSCKFKRATVL